MEHDEKILHFGDTKKIRIRERAGENA